MAEIDGYADQLAIETPEQVELRFPIAGIGSRFVAVVLDHLIQFGLYVLLVIVIIATSSWPGIDRAMNAKSDSAQKWLIALFGLLNFLWLWCYFALFEALWNGRTPGKSVMKLRVLKDSGRSITLFEALARNLLRFVDYLPGFYLAGLVSMVLTRENKRLGDLVAGTIVVHERAEEQPLLTFGGADAETQRYTPQAQLARAASEGNLPADAVAKLGTEDLHVIETFFARALDLSMPARELLGTRLASQMAGKMGVEMPPGMTAERLLELIVYRMRGTGRH